jgi:hypothetical protein
METLLQRALSAMKKMFSTIGLLNGWRRKDKKED